MTGVFPTFFAFSAAAASILAQTDFFSLLRSPMCWGLALAGLGLWCLVGGNSPALKRLGGLIAGSGLLVVFVVLPKLSPLGTAFEWAEQIVFWVLAAAAVGCAAAAISSRKPVYSAIWFAGSLLGVAGLFVFQNAQFLGMATIVVYAGAIVVTFLFVLMLANPEGHTRYDRITWGPLVIPSVILATLVLVASISGVNASPPPPSRAADATVDAQSHMAPLGAELFARHLVAVEVAGTILLVALVGAVAIVIQGKDRRRSELATRIPSQIGIPPEGANS